MPNDYPEALYINNPIMKQKISFPLWLPCDPFLFLLSNLMASSSKQTASSSSSPQWKYSVFLNFRGEDTRKGFVSHLYRALVQHGIHTFKDDEELEIGNEFPPGLMEAIEGSRIFVVVISQNYADSSWCLNELVKIVECRDKGLGQTVIPVFYNVNPSHVRKQEGTFATAIANRGNISNEGMWRDALTKVGSIDGYDARKSNDDATLVEELVRKISDILWDTSTSNMDGLVGIDKRLEEMSSLLSLGSNDVRMVGIWGMGGIGKTTIARAVYDRFSCRFQGTCFLPNVKESFRKDGAVAVRKELLSQIFMETNLTVRVKDGGSNIVMERLRNIISIIVLDDVDNLEQLDILARKCDWFGLGSRIIITARDKHLLTAHGVEDIYEVNSLQNDDALQLFSLKAFRGNPIPDEYSELCERVMRYAKGLPLALKVLGSSLCGKSKREWGNELKKLESIPALGVHDVLKVSYNDLDAGQKAIFLDIACFFNGSSEAVVKDFVDSRYGDGFSVDISALIKKSLLTMQHDDGDLEMHDLLQQMGREIVRLESINDPGKRSRLLIPADVERVLTNNMLRIDGNNFESLPENIAELSNLEVLQLSRCRKLKSLPELPLSLIHMIAHDCVSLETVSTSWHSISPKRASYFFYTNCFNLSQNAQSNIVENFLRQTEYTGPAFHDDDDLMIHSHKVPHGYFSRPGLTVNIPGSEIPEFFSYQSTGSFLTADLPRDWNNSDFMGFAMCIVVAFNSNDSEEDTSKDVDSMNPEEDTSKDVDRMNPDDDNSRNIGNFLVHCELFTETYEICPSSDHIVMGYDANLATEIGGDEQLNSSNIFFKFTIHGGTGPSWFWSSYRAFSRDRGSVKKCGVGLVYKNERGRKRRRDLWFK